MAYRMFLTIVDDGGVKESLAAYIPEWVFSLSVCGVEPVK